MPNRSLIKQKEGTARETIRLLCNKFLLSINLFTPQLFCEASETKSVPLTQCFVCGEANQLWKSLTINHTTRCYQLKWLSWTHHQRRRHLNMRDEIIKIKIPCHCHPFRFFFVAATKRVYELFCKVIHMETYKTTCEAITEMSDSTSRNHCHQSNDS